MKILITGPQGSGKTTQAKLLADYLHVPLISIGESLREMAKMPNDLGKKITEELSKGDLVDDEIVGEVVKKRIAQDDVASDFVMDGYPRSLSQLKLFDPYFDQVFYLEITDDIAMQRLLQRGREDDTEPLIKERLKLYHQLTKPALHFYAKQGILSRIDGMGSIKQIQERIRDSYKFSLMRKSGEITAAALKKVLQNIKKGVTGLQLDHIAETEIKKKGGELSFKSVQGYEWASCITINDQVVHGIPTERKIIKGDIVSIDLGAVFKGWHTDAAWTVLVRNQKSEIRNQIEKFLKIGEEALWQGIAEAVEGNSIGDISSAIQKTIEGAGYSVVRSLVGHGVGRALHEEPEVPGIGEAGTGLKLQAGMTLAIEVIYTMGRPEVKLEPDGWTISSEDHSLAGLFEMTVSVGPRGGKAEVLTDWRKIPISAKI